MAQDPADASRDLSILVTLARLKNAGKIEWLKPEERRDLVERLEAPASKRLAEVLIQGHGTKTLATQERRDLQYVEGLAAGR